ncbi:MAG: hypothetical protein F4X14_11075 [Caldilineaceae bacterium SB0661_bin_32]|uniref:Lamin tail domain-containing protein n=1 Tax=Caldilineaceae bacterium SB0661_bin_32 TaxID=2605255 RepID=A0A6B1D7X9_9CHLR|nr:hypothetical protein [Caldilineaceae bacterium SB0661_bin_32]
MSQRNCFRLAAVTMTVLLLTIASVSVAAAHASPVFSGDRPQRELPPIPTDDDDDGGGATPRPGSGGNTNTGGGGGSTSTGGGGGSTNTGGGVAPPATENGLIRPVIYPWPPPNAIVLHPATPVQLSQAGSGLRVYFINRDGTSDIGPFFDNFSILASTYAGDPVTLYEGFNPGTGKPVTIDYLPAENKLRVSTFYADRPPHDFNKPYVFTVDPNHTVTHEQW